MNFCIFRMSFLGSNVHSESPEKEMDGEIPIRRQVQSIQEGGARLGQGL